MAEAASGLAAVGAVAGPGARLGVFAAGVGPLFVHRATAGDGVEVHTVAAGATGQGEDAVAEVEVVDQSGLFQPLGDLLGCFMLGLKGVDQPEPHQVGQAHFHRHGAAVGGAAVTQPLAVAGPGFAAVNVNNGDGGSHGSASSGNRRECSA